MLDSEHIITSWARDAVSHLGTIKLANGELEEWNVGWQPIGNVSSNAGRVVMLASNEMSMPSIVEVKNGTVKVLRGSGEFVPEGTGVSFPEPVSWPTSDGATAHGFYYPPTSASHTGPDDELAPLIVNVHGGPTATAVPGYDLRIQYWTSRGFGYLDVNYRGSMGYGTGYRKALEGKWGIYDVDDCVNGAQHLVDAGLVDPRRIAIRGGSAGGFTVLSAITRSSVFTAASSCFGVTDLKRLVRTTHKFESHYIGQLIGTQDINDPVLDERSPINHIEDINVPLLLIQGSEDPIVPAEQATAMYEALKEAGAPVALEVFQGEGHGFRLATNIRRRYEAELSFYRQVWGIGAASSHVEGQGEEETFTVKVENLH